MNRRAGIISSCSRSAKETDTDTSTVYYILMPQFSDCAGDQESSDGIYGKSVDMLMWFRY